MKYVLLILAGGTGVPTGVFLLARHLVYRHADEYGPAIRAAGRDLPTRADTAARQKEPANR